MRLLRRGDIIFKFSRCSASLNYQHGHPVLTIPLPSRMEPVMFTCKPVTGTVGSLIQDIVKTDGGVYNAEVFTIVSFILFLKNITKRNINTVEIIFLGMW